MFTLKGTQTIAQGVEQWIVCTPLLATQQHLEYHCNALFKHPALPVEVTLNRKYPR
jgi:hypothetical protein